MRSTSRQLGLMVSPVAEKKKRRNSSTSPTQGSHHTGRATASNHNSTKTSPRDDATFPGYNFNPSLRLYSPAPVASASTSTASVRGSIASSAGDARSPGVRQQRSSLHTTDRPRKSSTESLRRHIRGQSPSSPASDTGRPRHGIGTVKSGHLHSQSISSASSSSLDSMAGSSGGPTSVHGLGFRMKSAKPLSPTLTSDIVFPVMEAAPHEPETSSMFLTETLKPCIRDSRDTSSSGHPTSPSTSGTAESSPTTRRSRRSVSFAIDDPVIHHLRISSDSSAGLVTDKHDQIDGIQESGLVAFPRYDVTNAASTERQSSIQPGSHYVENRAMPGSHFTYVRSHALSTVSSRTSMSSEDWENHPSEMELRRRQLSCIRKATETALGLSLAAGWLVVGRILGPPTVPESV